MILLNLKNCIQKHYYDDRVEDNVKTNKTPPSNKRKISVDLKEVQVKKPLILMSQINDDSFTPNAESTKIINNNLFNSESHSDEYTQIVKELNLEDINFEESLTPKKNKSDSISSAQNGEMKKTDCNAEYLKKLMNIDVTIPLPSDNTNVSNFNAENISISQWSKGDVVLNGEPLEVLIYKNNCTVLLNKSKKIFCKPELYA